MTESWHTWKVIYSLIRLHFLNTIERNSCIRPKQIPVNLIIFYKPKIIHFAYFFNYPVSTRLGTKNQFWLAILIKWAIWTFFFFIALFCFWLDLFSIYFLFLSFAYFDKFVLYIASLLIKLISEKCCFGNRPVLLCTACCYYFLFIKFLRTWNLF